MEQQWCHRHVYTLLYEDKGDRSGPKSEVSLSTAAGQGSVWRTSVPAFRAELTITKQSAAVRGEPLAR